MKKRSITGSIKLTINWISIQPNKGVKKSKTMNNVREDVIAESNRRIEAVIPRIRACREAIARQEKLLSMHENAEFKRRIEEASATMKENLQAVLEWRNGTRANAQRSIKMLEHACWEIEGALFRLKA